MNIKHVCLQGFVRTSPCIFKRPVFIKGVLHKEVECTVCHKNMVVDSAENVII